MQTTFDLNFRWLSHRIHFDFQVGRVGPRQYLREYEFHNKK